MKEKIVKSIDFFIISAYTNIAGRDTLYTCETELTFKRYVISSDTRPPFGGYFIM